MFRDFSGRIAASVACGALAVGVLAGSLIGGASGTSAGAATAAVRSPSAPVPVPASVPVMSVSGNGRSTMALRTALSRVRRTGDGQFTLDSAGLAGQDRAADSSLVASMNRVESQRGAAGLASGGGIIETAAITPAASQKTTVITLVPGATLTLSGTEVVLDVSKQDVTDIENGATLGSAIANLVGAALDVAQVPNGKTIATIVADSLTVGSDALKLCAGNDGGRLHLAVSAPSGKLPTAAACGVRI